MRTNSPSMKDSMQIAHSVALLEAVDSAWKGATTVCKSSFGFHRGEAEEERLSDDSEESYELRLLCVEDRGAGGGESSRNAPTGTCPPHASGCSPLLVIHPVPGSRGL